MKVINIKNGILLGYTKNYSIYEMYTEDTDAYYMCIANYEANNYETVVDFPEEYFNSLLSEDKIEEIKKTCDTLYDGSHPYIYILPNVTTYDLDEAKETNDDHAYQALLRRLQKYTYNVYKNIISNNDNVTIDEKINLIVDTKDDKKFLDFLEINLENYFVPMYLERSTVKVEEVPTIIEEEKPVVKEETKVTEKPKTRTLKNDNDFGYSNIAFIAAGMVVGIIILIYLFLYK